MSTPAPRDLSLLPRFGRKSRCVALDLRDPSAVGAVALNSRGRLSGWVWLQEHGDAAARARAALDALGVRPQEVRILLGGEEALVATCDGSQPTTEDAVREALAAEGHRLDLAPLAWTVTPDSGAWLCAAVPDTLAGALGDAVDTVLPAGPELCVDVLLLHSNAATQDAPVRLATLDCNAQDMTLVVPGQLGRPGVTRRIRRTERNLELTRRPRGFSPLPVRLIGRARDEVQESLSAKGVTSNLHPLPKLRKVTLPDRLELAWMLATAEDPSRLSSVNLADRAGNAKRLRRITSLARLVLLLAILAGALITMDSLAARYQLRQRRHAFRTRQDQVDLARTVGSTWDEVLKLEKAASRLDLPWPAVGTVLHELPSDQPTRIGWEQLRIEDGVLTLEVSASGPDRAETLARLERLLSKRKDMTDLAWKASREDAATGAVLRTFSAHIAPPEAKASP